MLVIDIINDVAPLHDRRKELFVKTIFYADDIREELGRRFNYSLSEMQFFTLKELMVLKKKGELDKQEIEKRQESIFLDVDYSQGKFEISSGEKAIQLSKNEIREDYDEVSQFKGTIAFQGKSTGKVRVIYGEKGFDKMKKGDILVTGMTRPEMIPVMKKAAAIITDEGGLTCHASIISRELKIPCIVATRIATKVLKDGDKVEVDAIQGLVRKL